MLIGGASVNVFAGRALEKPQGISPRGFAAARIKPADPNQAADQTEGEKSQRAWFRHGCENERGRRGS
jgi:hypothetical protein